MPDSVTRRPPALYDALVHAGASPDSALSVSRALYDANHLASISRSLNVLKCMVGAVLVLFGLVLVGLVAGVARVH